MSCLVIRFQTSFLVQFASGLTFTRLNFLSQPTIGALARSGLWSRRMALAQAWKPSTALHVARPSCGRAALVGFAVVERPAVELFVLFDGQLGLLQFDLDAVALLAPLRAVPASPGTGSRYRG